MRGYAEDPRDLSAERLKRIARGYWDSSVLRTLVSLGICPVLDEGPATAADLASRIGANVRSLDAFLGACVALDLLERHAEHYTNSQQAADFLIPGKEAYAGDYLRHLTNHWNTYGSLDRLVRDGASELPYQNGYVSVDDYWCNYMRAQHFRAVTVQAPYLVRTVDLSGMCKLLDLGGGAASYSVALAAAYPRLTAHVIDAKEPLTIAREVVDEAGLAERVLLMEGDFFEMDLGQDADVVLISGVVLIKPDDFCRRLFRLAYDALRRSAPWHKPPTVADAPRFSVKPYHGPTRAQCALSSPSAEFATSRLSRRCYYAASAAAFSVEGLRPKSCVGSARRPFDDPSRQDQRGRALHPRAWKPRLHRCAVCGVGLI